jgi:hypothetical protein
MTLHAAATAETNGSVIRSSLALLNGAGAGYKVELWGGTRMSCSRSGSKVRIAFVQETSGT